MPRTVILSPFAAAQGQLREGAVLVLSDEDNYRSFVPSQAGTQDDSASDGEPN